MTWTNKPSSAHQAPRKGPPKAWRWLVMIVIVTALILAALFAEAVTGLNWSDGYTQIPEMIEDMGVWGQLGIVALMVVHCFVPFPAEFVALAAGSVYGTIHGTFLVWTGAMLGAMLSFCLARLFGRPLVDWTLPERQRALLDQWTADQGAFTLLVSRFIPVIAFNLINYAAGLTRVSWWTFLWTTGLGILPLTALMVHMGAQMRHLSWEWLVVISIGLIITAAVLHRLYRRRRHG